MLYISISSSVCHQGLNDLSLSPETDIKPCLNLTWLTKPQEPSSSSFGCSEIGTYAILRLFTIWATMIYTAQIFVLK